MNPKLRITLVLMVSWFVVLGGPCFLLWREKRQERLDQQLITAILRGDTPAALHALDQGADANTRYEPSAPVSVWETLENLLQNHGSLRSTAAHPLLMLLDFEADDKSTGGVVVGKDQPELVTALLAHGTRLDLKDANGSTPLYHALSNRKTASARILIQQGAEVTNNDFSEAVKYAVDPEGVAILELMLQHGADPNHVDATRITPLEVALVNGNPDAVRCLLRHGADPNKLLTTEAQAMRPLEYAEMWHMPEIVQLLKDAGARK